MHLKQTPEPFTPEDYLMIPDDSETVQSLAGQAAEPGHTEEKKISGCPSPCRRAAPAKG